MKTPDVPAGPGAAADPVARAAGLGVNLGPLEDYITFHLRMAQGVAFRAYKRDAGVKDLRQGWFAVLSLISNNPGITPVTLSRASGRDKSTLSPILRDLTRERLIRRQAIPNDRRSYALHLTPAGEERLAHLALVAAAHEAELDRIVGAEKPALLRILRSIAAELEASAKDA